MGHPLPDVKIETAASSQRAISRAGSTPRPVSRPPTPTISSRSVRSAMPTLQVMPSPSARALTYETRPPAARQSSAAATPDWLCWPASQKATAPKTALSAMRSMLESRKAPNRVEPPLIRAIVPSSRSVSAKTVTISAPATSWPRAPKPSAPTSTPRVPVTVTALGDTPARSSPRATGSTMRVMPARAVTWKIFAMAVPRYRPAAAGDTAADPPGRSALCGPGDGCEIGCGR